jgi:hypothetical protein
MNRMKFSAGKRFSGRVLIRRSLLVMLLGVLLPAAAFSQTTRTETTSTPAPAGGKKKVLIVPWDPKLFNCSSDITRAIAAETGQKYNQVQESLRKGMVEQLKRAFAATCTPISLLDDTAKMKRDLHYVYTVTSLAFTPVNFPINPTKADSAKLKKPQPGIKNGQIQAPDDEVEKYATTVVLSPNLLSYLKSKYGADYVVFINEIDIDNDLGADPYNLQGKEDFKRFATAHFTMFETATGKRVIAGKSKANFSSTSNTPKKIIDGAFNILSKAIYEKFVAALKPKE